MSNAQIKLADVFRDAVDSISQVPDRLVTIILILQEKLKPKFMSAIPGIDPKTGSWLACSLAALWEAGEIHRHYLKQILKLRLPRDREKLSDLLTGLHVHWDAGQGHLDELRATLPKYRSRLDRVIEMQRGKSRPSRTRKKMTPPTSERIRRKKGARL